MVVSFEPQQEFELWGFFFQEMLVFSDSLSPLFKAMWSVGHTSLVGIKAYTDR